ncbi:type II secretion system protein J [Deinococcus sp. YIM 77859]|uniref:PulJ/GspJ family protein n=1 Tax=Deinococcus sp. YIM 77859 TaxID=1540221 RepID=UPI00054F1995|nr:prepilin-type N-terminal cleavage/methylation domain-containing protein [Deinococcus sp. YIM 77859]
MKRRDAGLTLVELLVAMAIIGIVFALVTNWQTSTLSISTRTNALSQRLSELNDVTGYVGDRVRSALAVRTSGFTVNAASAPNSGLCDTVTPCLAVLVPVEEAEVSGSAVVYKQSFLQLIYRMEPRSTWPATDEDKVPDSWADNAANNVMILREYYARCTVTTTNDCSAFKTAFSTTTAFSGMNRYLVSDYLTSVDSSGSAITPFTYSYDATKHVGMVTLKFQGKQQVRGTTSFTPPTGPYTLTVQARNVE